MIKNRPIEPSLEPKDEDDVEYGEERFDEPDDWAYEQELSRKEDREYWDNRPGGAADYAYDPIKYNNCFGG